MFGQKDKMIEIQNMLHEILNKLNSEAGVHEILERRIMALEEKERELLDRLMAKDYGEFVLGQNVLSEEKIAPEEFLPEAQEDNAGSILEIS